MQTLPPQRKKAQATVSVPSELGTGKWSPNESEEGPPSSPVILQQKGPLHHCGLFILPQGAAEQVLADEAVPIQGFWRNF